MTISLEELQRLMNEIEGENLEFKEARQSYQFDKLMRYCSALANEGGGKVKRKAPEWRSFNKSYLLYLGSRLLGY
jgi:hypothetical protein